MTDEERNFRHRAFWLWEFARRNTKYQRDYDAFVQKWEKFTPIANYRREDVFAIILTLQSLADLDFVDPKKRDKILHHVPELNEVISSFVAKYGRNPKDYSLGHGAEEIIDALLRGDETMFNVFVDYEQRPLVTAHEELGHGRVQVVMDINRSLNMILKEITAIYYDCKYQDPEMNPRREVGQALDDCVRQGIKEAGGRIRSANLPRACGLWVFDHRAQNPKITANGAIEAFIEKFGANIELHGEMKTALDPRRVKALLERVTESIGQIAYLPLP